MHICNLVFNAEFLSMALRESDAELVSTLELKKPSI